MSADSYRSKVMLNAALTYAMRGYRVLPTRPGQKAPAVKPGHASSGRDEIIDMFTRAGEGCGVGITLDDLVVINVDQPPESGSKVMDQIIRELGGPPPFAITPNGFHLFFRRGPRDPLQPRTVADSGFEIITGPMRHVVAAPTIINGARYAFGPAGLPPIEDLPHLPESLMEPVGTEGSPDDRWGLPAHKVAEQIVRTRGRVEATKLAASLLSEICRHTESGGESDFPF